MSNIDSRATFSAQYQKLAGVEFDADDVDASALHDAIHSGIKATMSGDMTYAQAKRAFFTEHPDLAAAYTDNAPTARRRARGGN